MLETKELQSKRVEELREECEKLSREIYQMGSELKVTRKIEKPHLIREKKRDRARLLTVLRQKREGA
jgi:large subunit ribosomal protein L29